jgi:hypothetical protein
MLVDLVETMADREGLRATVFHGPGDAVEVGSNSPAALVAVLLRRQREKHGLSLTAVVPGGQFVLEERGGLDLTAPRSPVAASGRGRRITRRA